MASWLAAARVVRGFPESDRYRLICLLGSGAHLPLDAGAEPWMLDCRWLVPCWLYQPLGALSWACLALAYISSVAWSRETCSVCSSLCDHRPCLPLGSPTRTSSLFGAVRPWWRGVRSVSLDLPRCTSSTLFSLRLTSEGRTAFLVLRSPSVFDGLLVSSTFTSASCHIWGQDGSVPMER